MERSCGLILIPGVGVDGTTRMGPHGRGQPTLLTLLFQETSQRLANQIPFIIQYFMLQDNSDCLQKAMMQLLYDKEHYSWMLQEQSETSTKRRFLKQKIYRLAQARQALFKFSS